MFLLWLIIMCQNINKLFSSAAPPNIHTYDFQFLISPRYFQKLLNNEFLSITTTHLSAVSSYAIDILANIPAAAIGTTFTA